MGQVEPWQMHNGVRGSCEAKSEVLLLLGSLLPMGQVEPWQRHTDVGGFCEAKSQALLLLLGSLLLFSAGLEMLTC